MDAKLYYDPNLSDLVSRVLVLEAKVEQLQQMFASVAQGQANFNEDDRQIHNALRDLTVQRHATLQMCLADATVDQIAERFQISTMGAKGRLAALRHILSEHLGETINKTSKAVSKYRQVLDNMDDDTYARIAGIPRNWHDKWTPKDRKENPRLYN